VTGYLHLRPNGFSVLTAEDIQFLDSAHRTTPPVCLPAACAPPATIRIRFADGKSGQPLRMKSYEHGSGTIPAGGFEVVRIDGDSLIVTFNNVSTFSFRSEAFDPCDINGKAQQPPRYNLQQIVASGIVSPNHCGLAQAQPKPGELLVYSHHKQWWKALRYLPNLLTCA
jgi:hypothetical protein